MHMTKLEAVGGSVMLAIPKALLESLDLEANASVGVSISDGKLIVGPYPKACCTLAELLAQCDDSAPRNCEDEAWLADRSIGREAI